MHTLLSLILLALCIFSQTTSSQEPSPPEEITNKVNELKGYQLIDGVWEGEYFIKSQPTILANDLIEAGNKEFRVGIRITISGKQAKAQYKFKPNDDWTESKGAALLIPDQLGCHILIARNGGVWLERVFISIARTSENEGAVTVTRTVHNWYNDGKTTTPDFYTVFGEGLVKKASN